MISAVLTVVDSYMEVCVDSDYPPSYESYKLTTRHLQPQSVGLDNSVQPSRRVRQASAPSRRTQKEWRQSQINSGIATTLDDVMRQADVQQYLPNRRRRQSSAPNRQLQRECTTTGLHHRKVITKQPARLPLGSMTQRENLQENILSRHMRRIRRVSSPNRPTQRERSADDSNRSQGRIPLRPVYPNQQLKWIVSPDHRPIKPKRRRHLSRQQRTLFQYRKADEVLSEDGLVQSTQPILYDSNDQMKYDHSHPSACYPSQNINDLLTEPVSINSSQLSSAEQQQYWETLGAKPKTTIDYKQRPPPPYPYQEMNSEEVSSVMSPDSLRQPTQLPHLSRIEHHSAYKPGLTSDTITCINQATHRRQYMQGPPPYYSQASMKQLSEVHLSPSQSSIMVSSDEQKPIIKQSPVSPDQHLPKILSPPRKLQDPFLGVSKQANFKLKLERYNIKGLPDCFDTSQKFKEVLSPEKHPLEKVSKNSELKSLSLDKQSQSYSSQKLPELLPLRETVFGDAVQQDLQAYPVFPPHQATSQSEQQPGVSTSGHVCPPVSVRHNYSVWQSQQMAGAVAAGVQSQGEVANEWNTAGPHPPNPNQPSQQSDIEVTTEVSHTLQFQGHARLPPPYPGEHVVTTSQQASRVTSEEATSVQLQPVQQQADVVDVRQTSPLKRRQQFKMSGGSYTLQFQGHARLPPPYPGEHVVTTSQQTSRVTSEEATSVQLQPVQQQADVVDVRQTSPLKRRQQFKMSEGSHEKNIRRQAPGHIHRLPSLFPYTESTTLREGSQQALEAMRGTVSQQLPPFYSFIDQHPSTVDTVEDILHQTGLLSLGQFTEPPQATLDSRRQVAISEQPNSCRNKPVNVDPAQQSSSFQNVPRTMLSPNARCPLEALEGRSTISDVPQYLSPDGPQQLEFRNSQRVRHLSLEQQRQSESFTSNQRRSFPCQPATGLLLQGQLPQPPESGDYGMQGSSLRQRNPYHNIPVAAPYSQSQRLWDAFGAWPETTRRHFLKPPPPYCLVAGSGKKLSPDNSGQRSTISEGISQPDVIGQQSQQSTILPPAGHFIEQSSSCQRIRHLSLEQQKKSENSNSNQRQSYPGQQTTELLFPDQLPQPTVVPENTRVPDAPVLFNDPCNNTPVATHSSQWEGLGARPAVRHFHKSSSPYWPVDGSGKKASPVNSGQASESTVSEGISQPDVTGEQSQLRSDKEIPGAISSDEQNQPGFQKSRKLPPAEQQFPSQCMEQSSNSPRVRHLSLEKQGKSNTSSMPEVKQSGPGPLLRKLLLPDKVTQPAEATSDTEMQAEGSQKRSSCHSEPKSSPLPQSKTGSERLEVKSKKTVQQQQPHPREKKAASSSLEKSRINTTSPTMVLPTQDMYDRLSQITSTCDYKIPSLTLHYHPPQTSPSQPTSPAQRLLSYVSFTTAESYPSQAGQIQTSSVNPTQPPTDGLLPLVQPTVGQQSQAGFFPTSSIYQSQQSTDGLLFSVEPSFGQQSQAGQFPMSLIYSSESSAGVQSSASFTNVASYNPTLGQESQAGHFPTSSVYSSQLPTGVQSSDSFASVDSYQWTVDQQSQAGYCPTSFIYPGQQSTGGLLSSVQSQFGQQSQADYFQRSTSFFPSQQSTGVQPSVGFTTAQSYQSTFGLQSQSDQFQMSDVCLSQQSTVGLLPSIQPTFGQESQGDQFPTSSVYPSQQSTGVHPSVRYTNVDCYQPSVSQQNQAGYFQMSNVYPNQQAAELPPSTSFTNVDCYLPSFGLQSQAGYFPTSSVYHSQQSADGLLSSVHPSFGQQSQARYFPTSSVYHSQQTTRVQPSVSFTTADSYQSTFGLQSHAGYFPTSSISRSQSSTEVQPSVSFTTVDYYQPSEGQQSQAGYFPTSSIYPFIGMQPSVTAANVEPFQPTFGPQSQAGYFPTSSVYPSHLSTGMQSSTSFTNVDSYQSTVGQQSQVGHFQTSAVYPSQYTTQASVLSQHSLETLYRQPHQQNAPRHLKPPPPYPGHRHPRPFPP